MMHYTNQELYDLTQQESVGKALDSIPFTKIKDHILATYWEDAQSAMQNIEEYLEQTANDIESSEDYEDDTNEEYE